MSNFIVGLTGGIGSGKTQVSDRFAQLGITVVDTDILAREVVEPGQPAFEAIVERYGDAILQADGKLDRTALRQRVFADEGERQWLNQQTHPRIRQRMLAQCQAAPSSYVVLVVPLLVEGGLDKLVHRVLVVDVPESVQIARTSARDGNDPELVESILKRQASREQRLSAADDIIDNSGDLAQLDGEVQRLHQSYLSMAEKQHVADL
ncbi:dephospho-CoA kinase [Ferrimonas marina]|uniref:Dephospho-CoA kinase n=1 Tax=Ferrimonas marina TaxID=299255 RepID=A0A1M5XF84_9GAMM|nr:dephospho-CoA kinase [Ferrimonas marina]SHH98446.1 dephospho-CoA kinase [Ferrimonas marina]